ncbi:hypothetical protein Asppvi_003493 [Aspergillus pseudoviridinutans]|uniref:Uncharacterized protein n=1 Tax=Aspergillus pseudoviridinutans TaxID=1517512 RepID=A0A9P3BAY2_9EURO|nr:uncharacterized protein Asppvi_003493 [Aspergillus pseudoviridinutans]GIJ84644.1 hypothetical protein Asppvi_003493 [Aspergillus pseudoviridinutans]
MGVFEQIFRPGNEGRQKQVNDLITDIISDLKYIANASNGIIDSFNKMLGSSVAHVAYNSKDPKQLIRDVSDRYEEIEKLARAKYDDLDAVDKPTLDEVIRKWEGKMSPDDVDQLMGSLKNKGFASEAASIAASLAVFVVVTPLLKIAFRAFVANITGVVLGALAGLAVAAIVDAIAAEQNYHKLEEAIADLTTTKTLLAEYRDKVVNSADDLKLSVALAQRFAKKNRN